MVRFGHTTRAADGNRSSLGSCPLLQNAQAMSIAITTVLPEPVAILQPIRVSGGRLGSNGASISRARSSSEKRGVKLVRLPPMRISARYMIVSTALIWQKNNRRIRSSRHQCRKRLRVVFVALR